MSVSLIKVVVRRKYQQHTGSTDHVWFVKKLRAPQACYIYIALAHHKTGKLRARCIFLFIPGLLFYCLLGLQELLQELNLIIHDSMINNFPCTLDGEVISSRQPINTGLVLGMIASVVMAIAMEGLKIYISTDKLIFRYQQLMGNFRSGPRPVVHRLLNSLLHSVDVMMAYTLMLFAMVYNVWIMISIVLGAGIGHFFIRPTLFYFARTKMLRLLATRRSAAPAVVPTCHEEQKENGGEEESETRQMIPVYDPVCQSRQHQVRGKETSV